MGEMKVEEMLFLFVFLALALQYFVYDPLVEYWENKPPFSEQVVSFFTSFWVQVVLVILGIIIFIFFNIQFQKRKIEKIIEKKEMDDKLHNEEILILKFLDQKLKFLDSDELKKWMEDVKELDLSEYTKHKFENKLEDQQIWARLFYRVKLEEERVYEARSEKREIEEDIAKLKQDRYNEELKNKDNDKIILEGLDADNTLVYEIENLQQKEIDALKNDGFKEVNEYDPIMNENSTFLVKQILNHSPTHTFLVGRIKEILEQHLDPDEIRTHDTRDADITFEVESRIYAIEVETGTLLSKKKQLKEKVRFLNNKYGNDNWFFVVSRRDLVKKYKPHGKVTSRAGVSKIIEKLANS